MMSDLPWRFREIERALADPNVYDDDDDDNNNRNKDQNGMKFEPSCCCGGGGGASRSSDLLGLLQSDLYLTMVILFFEETA